MRVPGALGAVLVEHGGQALGVVGQMLERHRAVLDEGDGFAVALHAHHDVEAGFAHLPDRFLLARVGHLDDGLRQAEIAHQFLEPVEAAQIFGLIVLGELDEQQRIRRAANVFVHHGPEHGDVARQLDQGAVDQLDGDGTELDDVLGRLHRPAERREMADAERLVARLRRQLQRDALRQRQRALGADQQASRD